MADEQIRCSQSAQYLYFILKELCVINVISIFHLAVKRVTDKRIFSIHLKPQAAFCMTGRQGENVKVANIQIIVYDSSRRRFSTSSGSRICFVA